MTIAIVGVGETDYAWKRPAARRPALAVDAVRRALADAGLTAADVDGFVTEAYTLSHERAGRRGRPRASASATARSAPSSASPAPAPSARRRWPRWPSRPAWPTVVVSYYAHQPEHPRRRAARTPSTPATPAKAAFEMPFGYYGQPVYFAAAGGALPPRVRARPEQLGAGGRRRPRSTPSARPTPCAASR